MPPRSGAKRPKQTLTVAALEEQLQGYSKERELDVVAALCALAVPDVATLARTAEALVQHANNIEMYERKPLAVLARRLHDRMPRFAGDESVSSERTSLATCIAAACERTLGTVHECIADSAGACSAESSFNGGANDENAAPDALIASDASPTPPAATAQPQPPPLLRQLHALQTFSACLYTQDLVGEVFIHSILDHVRYSTASWPEGARNAAVRGLCDMTLFCGKRLETLGTLRSTMPDIYSHLELLAAGTALTQDTRDRIANTLELRARGWQPPTTPGAEETLGTVVTRAHTTPPATPERSLTATAPVATGDQELSLFGLAQIKPEAKSPKKEDISGDEPVLGFGAMLGAAGLSVESCAMPVAGSAAAAPLAGFPMLEPDEPRVKVEDMLAAVQDMGV